MDRVEGKTAMRPIHINRVQPGCNRFLFSNNVVSFSRSVVLSAPLFPLNPVLKTRMLSVRADYVLRSLL
jgi:hypothetical protein